MMKSSNLGLVLILCALLVFLLATELPNLAAHLITGIGILAAVAAVAMVGYVIFWLTRNAMSPVVRTEAEVVRRRTKDWDITITGETPEMALARMGTMGRNRHTARKAYNRLLRSADVPELEVAGGTEFFVTFRVSGREIEFLVPESVYVQSEEGNRGLLAFQGEVFKHFIPCQDASSQASGHA